MAACADGAAVLNSAEAKTGIFSVTKCQAKSIPVSSTRCFMPPMIKNIVYVATMTQDKDRLEWGV